MATYFGFDAYDVEHGSDPFVFISYKSEDCDQVAVYARYLHDHGINVWYDNGLHAGSDWESYLMSVIEKPDCKAVLLFVSAKVAQSTVIPLETTQARACKKPTVAIYLEPGLNLETLLNKAIRVYVEQRQSVNAYIGTENSVCAQVLEAAKMAMAGTVTVTHTSVDTLWKNAQVFLMNWRRSRNPEDIHKARGFLEQMTDSNPSDYRGWLGLATCECIPRVDSLDSAAVRLKNSSDYYSYIVTLGADDKASAEYTQVKSEMWRGILEVMQQELEKCNSADSLTAFTAVTAPLAHRFGHTSPDIKSSYERIQKEAVQREVQLRDQIREKEEEAAATLEREKVDEERRLKMLAVEKEGRRLVAKMQKNKAAEEAKREAERKRIAQREKMEEMQNERKRKQKIAMAIAIGLMLVCWFLLFTYGNEIF